MYESPITRITEDIMKDIVKREEDYLVESVHKVGFDIGKEELAKALQYDRDQYEKGFKDGRLSAQQWIPVTERLPEEKQDVLLAFKHNLVVGFWEDILNDGGQAWYANSGNGWFTGTESVDDDGFPIAWMPLPEPWKGEDDVRHKEKGD